MTDLYCAGEQTPQVEDINVFYNVNLSELVLHVPASAIEDYQNTYPWSQFGKIVPLTDGIKATQITMNNSELYDIQGRKVTELQKGLNIIRYSDGTTRKVIQR